MSTAKRPSLPLISEEMKAWSAALEAEVRDWPHLSTRSFFGFTALYCKDKIFAALPRTRGWNTSTSLAFKLDEGKPTILARLEKDGRVGTTLMSKTRWHTFELSSDSDLHDALDWLARAYNAAGKKRST